MPRCFATPTLSLLVTQVAALTLASAATATGACPDRHDLRTGQVTLIDPRSRYSHVFQVRGDRLVSSFRQPNIDGQETGQMVYAHPLAASEYRPTGGGGYAVAIEIDPNRLDEIDTIGEVTSGITVTFPDSGRTLSAESVWTFRGSATFNTDEDCAYQVWIVDHTTYFHGQSETRRRYYAPELGLVLQTDFLSASGSISSSHAFSSVSVE